MSIPNIVADFKTTLALKVAVGATTATLSSVTDDDGHALANGTYGFTIDRNNSSKEYITCTITGTSVTAVKTIDRGTGIGTSGFAIAHRKGAEVIISDFVAIKRLQDIFETGYDAATTPITDYMLATKKYVDDLAFGGATTVDKVTIAGTAGETIAAQELVYLKASDGRWWKCDADTAATVDNVPLGIAQGSGTAGNAITSGVLIKGVDANFSGLTTSSVYYASNTAGGVSLTAGTVLKVVGISTATTKLYFDPDFNKRYKNYAVDAVGTDAYAITLQTAFSQLEAGMEVTFKAGTANTGACTLAVNGLTAKTIKKDVSSDLVTGDILADQIVKVVYDGTNFQMVSHIPQSTIPVVRTYLNAASPATWSKPTGLKYVIVEVQAAGGGGQNTSNSAGGGGGAGGYSRKLIAAATLGSTETVTIGAGGAAGSPGSSGADSSFGAHCSATGGVGGSDDGGVGGIGSGGDVNIKGGGGCAGGQGATGSGLGNGVGSGNGGSAVLGGGGAGGSSNDGGGGNGGVYGGGGAGAGSSTGGGTPSAGDGGAGIVIVTEYYA